MYMCSRSNVWGAPNLNLPTVLDKRKQCSDYRVPRQPASASVCGKTGQTC